MSADLPIRIKVTNEGIDTTKDKFDALFEIMRKGTNVSYETEKAAKDLRKEFVAKSRAISTLGMEFRTAHPSAMIFSRAISAVGSVTRQALGLLDSYNILMISLQGRTSNVTNANIDVEKKQRAYNDAVKQFGPDSQPALDAFADLQQSLNDQKTATDEAKDAKVRYVTQMGLLGFSAATLIGQLVPLYDKLDNLKVGTGLLGDKFGWLTGLLGAPIIFAGILVAGIALSAYLYSQGESFDSLDKKANNLFKDFDKTVSERLKDFEKSMDDFTSAILEGDIQKLAETAPIQILSIFGRLSVLVLAAIGRLAVGILEALGKLTVSMLAIFGKFVLDSIVGLGKWVVDGIAKAVEFVGGLWDNLKKGFDDIVSKVYNYGKSIVENIAKGITDAIGSVINAASNVASVIGDYLGIHSPAKKGALSHIMEWGPNLVNTYATGMDSKLPQLQSSVSNVARTLSIGNLNVSVAGGNGNASGRDVSRSIILELNRYMRWA